MANGNPVPQNQPLQAFPTPNVGDVLIYVIVDSTTGPFGKVKEYGTAYPNAAQYPDHKLVFISPIDEEGNRKYYYACDRKRQDDYNFEISYPYGGRKDAPRYTRTYFLKREGYTALADGTADPVFSSAILIGQEMKRVGIQELDSLYVLVQRVYDIIPAATAFDGATDSTLHTYGISVDYPYNDEAYPRLTWRVPIKHTGYSPTADLAACTVAGFTTLVLVEQEYKQNEQAAELGTWTRVYEKLPSRKNKTIDDDADWGQVSKFDYRDAEGACPAIGATFTDNAAASYKVVRATQTPARGSVIAISVVALPSAASQTGTLKHSKVTDADWGSVDKYEQWGLASRTLPAIGVASSIGSGTVLTAQLLDNDGVYANLVVTTLSSAYGTSKKSQDIDKIFCVASIVERKVPVGTALPTRGSFYTSGTASGYVLDSAIKNIDGVNATIEVRLASSNFSTHYEYKLDGETGKVFTEKTTYQLGGTQTSGRDVNASAEYTESKRIDCNFYVSTTSKTTTLTTESNSVIVPAIWPAVLLNFRIDPLYDNDNLVSKYMVDFELKKRYVGPCRGLETRSWSVNPPPAENVTTLIEEALVYQGIFLNFAIPSCLHYAITIYETTGSNHPLYRFTTRSKQFSATPRTAWPASYVQDCNISRYKGGWLKEVLTVYAPA